MVNTGGHGGGGDQGGRGAFNGGGQSGRGQMTGNGAGQINGGFGRGRNIGANGNNGGGRFNSFEVGGPSGTAGGSGFGSAGNFGFQGGNGVFQGNGTALSGNGGNFQGNNGFNGANGGFDGGSGAATFQANGGGFNGANFQGDGNIRPGGQGMDGFQFNAGAGFSNYGAARNYSYNGRGGFRYFRPFNGRGGGRFNNRRGRGYGGGVGINGGAVVPYVYPPAAVQQNAQGNTVANGQLGISSGAAANPPGNQPGKQPVQGGQQGADEFIPLEEGEDAATSAQCKKQKNPEKLKCHRCGIVGHFAIDCVTVLCNNCELPGHLDEECPLLDAPKPHMIMYGIGEERLCFFEMPCTKSYKPKMENTRMGMLSVTGGEITIPRIVSQLQRIVPSDQFHWDMRQVGHNVYKVAFPSKAELERLRVFGTFHVPNSAIEFKFDSWTAKIEPNCLLPEIWLRVSGLPPRRKGDFLAVWALGTLFGKTLQVDMKHTRQHGVAMLRIGCIDYTCIPRTQNIFVHDGFYDLTFEVEIPEGDEVMDDAPVDGNDGPADDDPNRGQNNEKQDQTKADENSTSGEGQGKDLGMKPKNDGNTGPGGAHTAQLVMPGVRFSPAVKLMMKQSKHLLRSTSSATNAEKPREEGNVIPVVEAHGISSVHVQSQGNDVKSAKCALGVTSSTSVAANALHATTNDSTEFAAGGSTNSIPPMSPLLFYQQSEDELVISPDNDQLTSSLGSPWSVSGVAETPMLGVSPAEESPVRKGPGGTLRLAASPRCADTPGKRVMETKTATIASSTSPENHRKGVGE
ncbi:hypothetical protein ACQ4PT_019144 [Festuca glaucescens]